MAIKTLIKPSEYHDSVTLMLVARELSKLPGVNDAAVVMGTEANKSILENSNLLTPEAKAATPNDLVIAIDVDGSPDDALAEADNLLSQKASSDDDISFSAKTIRGAVKMRPDANLAVISVAGRYAADESWEALLNGLHVLLFSDNVSKEDELALKEYGRDNGLLVMGPGAGTAIINGVALGFANVIPEGPVGIVSAAGTGLQETSTLLGKNGIGITQGIGTGGGDVKDHVGGIVMLMGLEALQNDPATEVILLVSKPLSEGVTAKVVEQLKKSSKPTVVCMMGGDPEVVAGIKNAYGVTTLQEAGLLAAKLAGADLPDVSETVAKENAESQKIAVELKKKLKPGQKYLRGLYTGGTLCYESQVIWRSMMKETVLSNAPLGKIDQLPDSLKSEKHTTVDLGEEEFTVGRPHPMIDNDLRIRRLYQEAADPEVAVIVMDVVIGYGAHPDPVSELAPAIGKARQIAAEDGRELIFIASVTGTDGDPQELSRQIDGLEAVGVVVCNCNAVVARLAAMIVE